MNLKVCKLGNFILRMKKTKILYFSEFYAPQNTVQTFRNLKISKYLSKYGFKQYIFTADAPKDIATELNKDIPPDAVIFRKKLFLNKKIENFSSLNLKPNFFTNVLKLLKDIVFPVDKNIWWVLSFIPKMIRTIKKEKINYVMIGGYPYSAFVGGYILKKICKIKLILDFHDPWTTHPMCLSQSFIRRKSFDYWEKKCISNADLVTVCIDCHLTDLKDKYKPNARLIKIPNGFDVDDFINIEPEIKPQNIFRFLYSGKLSINSAEYNPESIITAFLAFIKKHSIDDCEIMLVGSLDEDTKTYIQSLNTEVIIFTDFLPKDRVLKFYKVADAFIHFHYPSQVTDRMSLKITEYAVYHKPIISFNVKNGTLFNFLEKYSLGETADSYNVEEMIELFYKTYKGEMKICDNPIEVLHDYNWNSVVKVLHAQMENLSEYHKKF